MTKTLRGQKIVVATHNRGKLAEFADLLKPYGVTAVSAGELGLAVPEETEYDLQGQRPHQGRECLQSFGSDRACR